MTGPRFVEATLVAREIGAAYEGVVHDYFLTLRTSAGGDLIVFDMEAPVSESLELGSSYQFVLLVSYPTAFRQGISGPSPRRWSGHVSIRNWRAAHGAIEVARPELAQLDWVVVECKIGAVLLNPRLAPQPLVAGEFVEWDEARWDLYGVTRA